MIQFTHIATFAHCVHWAKYYAKVKLVSITPVIIANPMCYRVTVEAETQELINYYYQLFTEYEAQQEQPPPTSISFY